MPQFTTYADPGFESLAATPERLPDTYADGDGPAVAYRRAMRLLRSPV